LSKEDLKVLLAKGPDIAVKSIDSFLASRTKNGMNHPKLIAESLKI